MFTFNDPIGYCDSLLDGSGCPQSLEDVDVFYRETRLMKEPTDVVKDGVSEVSKDNELALEEIEKMSSVLPTMWMGSQRGRYKN